jgi:Ras-related protein Rab-1A
MNSNFDYLIKLLMLGDPAVGKTNFLIRFTENTFVDNYMNTIGFDYKSETISIDEKVVKLQIWDTAGQERYKSVTKNFYHKAQGIVLMYDVTSEDSFCSIKTWLKSIKEASGDKISIILVGNKIDLEGQRKVSEKEGRALAEENGLQFMESSGKADINVKEVFRMITKKIVDKKDVVVENSADKIKKLGKGNGKKGKCC